MIRAPHDRSIALGAAIALALPGAVAAQTESRLSADLSATAGYSNNPFTLTGSNTGAEVVSVDVAPRYQLATARSVFTVSADVNRQQYISKYGGNDNYSGALDYQGRPSERVTAHARVDLSSTVLGTFNNYLPLSGGFGASTIDAGLTGTGTTGAGANGTGTTAIGPGGGATTIVPITSVNAALPYTDIGLYGLRNRRRVGRVSGDLGTSLSVRDSLTIAGYAEAARYNGITAADYDDFGGSLGYSRRLTSQWSAGLRGNAAAYNYRGVAGNSRIYSISATASGQLNERWSVDGSFGVTFVGGGAVGSTRSTSLSGDIDLCRRGPASTLCLQASRLVSPTGLAGSQYVTSVGGTWNRRIDQRQGVSLGVSYTQVGGDNTRLVTGGLPLQNKYLQTTVGYDRRVSERMRLIASANYRQLFVNSGTSANRPADVGGQIGLSYRLGDRR